MILGVDLSLNSTGLCIARPGEPLETRTISTGTTGWERVHTVCGAIWRLAQEPNTLVAIEGYAFSRIEAHVRAVAELRGVLLFALWRWSIPVVEVGPTVLKKYATGKGGGAGTTKDSVLLAVERRYGHLVTVAGNDEADAVVLAAMALHRYAPQPLAPVPAGHAAALAGVAWPDYLISSPETGRAAQ